MLFGRNAAPRVASKGRGTEGRRVCAGHSVVHGDSGVLRDWVSVTRGPLSSGSEGSRLCTSAGSVLVRPAIPFRVNPALGYAVRCLETTINSPRLHPNRRGFSRFTHWHCDLGLTLKEESRAGEETHVLSGFRASDSSELSKRGWDNVETLPWTSRGGGHILPSSNTKGALPPGSSPHVPIPRRLAETTWPSSSELFFPSSWK